MASSSSQVSFLEKLNARIAETDSLLCIGLDPHESDLFPNEHASVANSLSSEVRCDAAFTFCKTIIDATIPYAACYKPNAAFFEALGDGGAACLARVCREIPTQIPILLDVKRGDIGSTAEAYAKAAYEHVGADAVTLSPLMGWDSVSPFVTDKYSHKGAFLLCKTSNPGSNDLLALQLQSGETLYSKIAHLVGHQWAAQTPAALGLVVGATDAQALMNARRAAGPNVWILAPGVGAQGGDLEKCLRAGMNEHGGNLLIPVSRGISRANDPADAAKKLVEQIRAVQSTFTCAAAENSACSIAPYQRDFIEFSLSQGVLKFGSFVLKSGRTSPYFFNAGLFATGASLFRLSKAYASAIMASPDLAEGGIVKFDVIFGPAYKGISLGALVSSALYSDFGVDVGFAYNRKEAKDHGEGGTLVGAPMQGKRVLVVDDVITAGTAIREAYTLLKGVDAEPIGVVIALDRAEIRSLDDRISAVQAVSRDLGLHVVSIVSLPQLQEYLQLSSEFGDATREAISAYRRDFGVE
ncbi:hypothetical protein MPSEU_000648200 [Mayamaea pseudoterrestris]|nr:hypothetical protein MPSEU_000648200 [Mayamaea pseudoterrestris]